jgi:biopolymer transport protein ExbD
MTRARQHLRRRPAGEDSPDFGFQIAPMIDVVFVVLVFFMSLSATLQIEQELNSRLPGSAVTSAPVAFPDEQIIAIETGGQVLLNDDPVDTPTDADLPRLLATLKRLRQNADAARTTLVVTVASDPLAPYSRTVDVLNALAAARVDHVTFSAPEEP